MSLRTLVSRMTMGFSQEELALATSMGAAAYIEYHLNYAAIDDSAVDAKIASLFPLLSMSALDIHYSGIEFEAPYQLQSARIVRAKESRRQLHERMVEFWTDHFNIYVWDDFGYVFKPVDDREVIRPHALGKFIDILRASAHSPAMLAYLDNYTNYYWAPQENYARELMELHTVSVEGGYTQEDVHEVARCFTGWQFYWEGSGGDPYTFVFQSGYHDYAEKTVLGHTIPAGGGEADGERVLEILANHPSTARFISKKLLRYFWGEKPSEDLITLVAGTFTASGGDISQVMRVILTLVASGGGQPKYQRPLGQVLATLRSLPVTITNFNYLAEYLGLRGAGQVPFEWAAPNGYPDAYPYWVNLVLPRWNFGARLTANSIYGVTIDWTTLLAGAATSSQIADRIDVVLFGGEMPAQDKATVTNYMKPPSAPPPLLIKEAVGLALGSQAMQWY